MGCCQRAYIGLFGVNEVSVAARYEMQSQWSRLVGKREPGASRGPFTGGGRGDTPMGVSERWLGVSLANCSCWLDGPGNYVGQIVCRRCCRLREERMVGAGTMSKSKNY